MFSVFRRLAATVMLALPLSVAAAEGCDEVIEKVKGALAGFAKAATE